MASEARAPVSLADLTIVDGDSHLAERTSEDDIVPYIDEKHEAVRRMIDSANDVSSEIYNSTRATPAFLQATEGAGLYGHGKVHTASFDPETKLSVMDELGIDYAILTAGSTVGIPDINHTQTAVALANAYNSWVADTFLDADDRLKVLLMIAPQKPEKAVEEIERFAGEDNVVGVQLPPQGLLPPAGHERYDPIYETAEKHDLPIVMHSGDAGSTSVFPVQRKWNEIFVEDHALTFPWFHMWNLTTMVFRGVPERFPDLDFVIQEAGISWVPFLKWRLNDHYLQCSQELPYLTKLPSKYIEDQFYFNTQPLGHTEHPEHMASIIEMVGPDQLMFASDEPHPDFDPPEELFSVIRSRFDEDAIRGMMGGNAMDVFGFGE